MKEAKDLVPLHEMLSIARDKTGNSKTTDNEIRLYLWMEHKEKTGKNPIRVSFNQPMKDLYDESLQHLLEEYLERKH